MSAEAILELTTESANAIDGVEEDVTQAIDYLDSLNDVVVGDLSEAGAHIAFVVLEKLRWAEGIVNSYGGRRYEIPMLASDLTKPYELVDATLSVARFKLYSRRTSIPDDVIADYEMAMDWLERLAAGKVVVNLVTSAGEAPATSKSAVGFADRTSVSFGTSTF